MMHWLANMALFLSFGCVTSCVKSDYSVDIGSKDLILHVMHGSGTFVALRKVNSISSGGDNIYVGSIGKTFYFTCISNKYSPSCLAPKFYYNEEKFCFGRIDDVPSGVEKGLQTKIPWHHVEINEDKETEVVVMPVLTLSCASSSDTKPR